MKALDLRNKRFGNLVAIEKSKNQTHKSSIMWDCVCDCGKSCKSSAAQLNAGYRRSCGCLSYTDLTGQRFGMLTVIERVVIPGRRTMYICECDCGSRKKYEGSKLKFLRRNCGCNRRKWVRPKAPIKDVVTTFVYNSYMHNAKHKHQVFRLTKEEFRQLIFDKCFYCGEEPKTLFVKWRQDDNCHFNGIDRQDNEQGYIQGNVVTCCTTCNYKKGKQHVNDFLAWIAKVYKHSVELV